MQPKPEHFDAHYAESFKNQDVVNAYRNRPPYPDEVFDILLSLISDEPRRVLDVGAGSGDIARRLVASVEQVDAVDFSQTMIARGKELPNGNNPHLHWLYGKIEELPLASLTPPYALITAGSSIHWLDWEQAFPRFRTLLTPYSYIALIYRRTLPMPWDAELRTLRRQLPAGRERNHRSASARRELEQRGLFFVQGEKETAPIPFVQSIDDFIEGLHSRSSFTVERMGQQQAADFDSKARTLLLSYCPNGQLPLQVVATVTWGHP